MEFLDTELLDTDLAVNPVPASYFDPLQPESGAATHRSNRIAAVSSRTTSDHQPIQDVVDLSEPARVQSMKQEGASESQIAATLGITEEEVEQDLRVTGSIPPDEPSFLEARSAKQ